jgi:alkylated DNA repair dioxygenase AlkB
VVRGLAHPAQLAALRRYHRALVAEGYVGLGDKQVPARYVATNEPLARVLHTPLAGYVSALAGAPMKPSYTYSVSYLAGASLAPHTDREQCELTISMLVDESPELIAPCEGSRWPLHVAAPGGEAAVRLQPGDGLLLYGRELAHWRDALPEGMRSTSILFHFVPEAFTGSLG